MLDGNHRCYEFLRRSIPLVPVLFSEVDSVDHIPRNQAYLPPRAYLEDRPPLMTDFLDDTYSVAATGPSIQRVVIIQAFDTNLRL